MNQQLLRHAHALHPERLPSWPAVSIALLLILAVIVPPGVISGMNMYLLLLALIAWAGSGEPFDRNLLRSILPFGIIIFVGLAVGAGADRYLYLKDAWYVSNPAVIISVGYVLYRCKPDVPRGLRAFVIGGTLLGILYLVPLLQNPDLLMRSATSVRGVIGTGYYAPALAFTILCAHWGRWQEGLKLPSWIASTCLVICATSIVACFSRTMFIVAVIGALSSAGLFSRRASLRIGLAIVIGATAIAIMSSLIDTESQEMQRSFIGKLARSFHEVSIHEYYDIKSISENWRGYETARALRYYAAGSPLEWLIGYGFGAQLDIGLSMNFSAGGAGEPMRLIPIFHNGYIYLLIKGGLLAIALYVFVLAWLSFVANRVLLNETPDRSSFSSARILQAITLSLVFTTWVVSGAFNKLDLFSFLLAGGFLLAALTDGPAKRR